MSDLTPEDRVRRVGAALAEAGYPQAAVAWNTEYQEVVAPGMYGLVPTSVWWRAKAISDVVNRCWACFSQAPTLPQIDVGPCTHDPLTSPWPEVVR